MRTRGDQVKERSKEFLIFLLILLFPLLYVFFLIMDDGKMRVGHCRPPYIPAKVSHTQEIDIVPKVFPCRPRPRAVPEMGDTF